MLPIPHVQRREDLVRFATCFAESRSRLAVFVGQATGSTMVAATFDVTSSYLRAILRMSKDDGAVRRQVKTVGRRRERKHEQNFLSGLSAIEVALGEKRDPRSQSSAMQRRTNSDNSARTNNDRGIYLIYSVLGAHMRWIFFNPGMVMRVFIA